MLVDQRLEAVIRSFLDTQRVPDEHQDRVSVDDVDKGIVYLLQANARTNTAAEIAERVGVSSSTVSNRINALEDADVITGYHPSLDYEKLGLDHRIVAHGTVPLERRAELAERALTAAGVVTVWEMLSTRSNLCVEIVAQTPAAVERSLAELDDMGIDVERIRLKRRELTQPFDHYGKEFTDAEETDPG